MNKKSKIALLALCAVFLVAASIIGTVAYLTDTDSAVNTFTVGNVDITLDEAAVNPDGTVIEGADRVSGNEYHLIPGQTYTKDPTVTVKADSEESYVRMLVTINVYSALKTIFGDDFLPQNYVTGWDNSKWPCYGITENSNDTVTYEFRYYQTVNASNSTDDIKLEALFESFTLPGEGVSGDDLESINDLKITVVGHAIQKAGFDTADKAWAAFDKEMANK